MEFENSKDINGAYIKFTENKIVKTETLAENINVDLDKEGKPVGVEFFGKNVNISE